MSLACQTYEILKDHPVPVDVSDPRVDVSDLRIGDLDSLRAGARPHTVSFTQYAVRRLPRRLSFNFSLFF